MSGPLNSDTIRAGAAGAAGGGGYSIAQSIRFNDDDTPYLQRTPGSSGNDHTWTFSCWLKRGSDVGSSNTQEGILGAGNGVEVGGHARYDALNIYNDQIQFGTWNGSLAEVYTVALLRDPAAWYHIVVRYDDTQSTDTNRIRIYINGSLQTFVSTPNYPDQNQGSSFNGAFLHRIGANAVSTSRGIDGYLSEIVMIDGASLGPGSFGETNDDGVWVPINVSGLTFGTNGFYITGATASDLGEDFSGNNNDFSSSGLTAADSLLDSPTNNMPTLNPLSSGTGTLSDGNLQYVGVSSWTNSRLNLLVPDTGKWALRFKSTTSYQQFMVGLCAPDSATTFGDLDQNGVAMIRYNTYDGNFVTRVTGSRVADTGPPAVAAQTFFQLLFDMDNGKIGVAADDATSGTFADISTYSALDLNAAALQTARQPYVLVYSGTDSSAGAIVDAGQSGWETTVTGFKNLILANLDTPTISDGSKYFQATTYTGDGGSSHEINQTGNSSFEPSLVWIKSRSAATNNVLQDQVRGNFVLFSELANAQGATGGGWVNSFDSNGFTVNVNAPVNDSGKTFVGWQWKAAGSGSSNTDGSITSSVSADTTSGFSIATYTGTGSNATVGHGLGAVPKMIIIKDTTNAESWIVYNEAVGNDGNVYLNLTNGKATQAIFQDTTPTSSVFSLGTIDGANKASAGHVAYCFAEVEGYSSISSYTGNGSTDGPFVYTGFKPAFVMTKRTNAASDWKMWDNERGPYNVNGVTLAANAGGTESTGTAQESDFLSNGFKIRGSDTETNGSGSTYIYMAFAENPFGGDGVAPATAR